MVAANSEAQSFQESLGVRAAYISWIVAGWPGRFINVRGCGGMPMLLLKLRDTLELLVKGEGNVFPVLGSY